MTVKDYLLLSHNHQLHPQDFTLESSLHLTMDMSLNDMKFVLEVLKLHSRQRLGEHIGCLIFCHNILELHLSLLYHIYDVMVPNIDMLGLVMKHWVLRQLHTTLVVIENTSFIWLYIKHPYK